MEIRGLLILILAVMVSGAAAATFMFKNNCQYTVWPGSLAGSSSTQLSSTGFELAMGASQSIDSPASWSGKFWARTGCSNASGKFTCATADCGSGQIECNGAGESTPATLAEFTVAASGGQDTYDVSLVDGFNLPLSITPQGSSGCSSTSCPADINSMCPMELAFKGPNGSVVGCKSACVAFNQPQYCCTGAFGTPDTCPPTNFSMIFKKACPQAYSYAYDDKSSTFTCIGGTNYLITLCP